MIDISSIPNVDPATANLINGEMVDVTTPGDGTGTPVRKDWQSDLYYALIAIMNESGIEADNSAEGATSSQVKDAILRVARKQVQGPSYANLLVKRNAVSPNSKIDITFDKLWIEGIEKTSGSYTIDITASGALGLDTGAEAISTWYYAWIIAKADGTVSALLSASSTAPTLPAGYIYKRLVSMVRNDSGGNFVDFVQTGYQWKYTALTTAYSTSSTTLDTGTNRDLSVFIPDLVSKIKIYYQVSGSKSGAPYTLVVSLLGYVNGVYVYGVIGYGESGSSIVAADGGFFELITTNKNIRTVSSSSTASPTTFSVNIYISGFEIPL